DTMMEKETRTNSYTTLKEKQKWKNRTPKRLRRAHGKSIFLAASRRNCIEGSTRHLHRRCSRRKATKREAMGRRRKEEQKRRYKYSSYKEPNLGILQSLTKSPKEILASEKVVKTFTKPPKMVSKTRDTSKYCKFHQDYDYETNACRELKNQIKEGVKLEKLAHMVKGVRKGKAKHTNTQLGHIGERGAYPYEKNSRQPFEKERTPKNHEH
nr:hypothetical protein [Tanacetum cinerariifolium]